MRAAILNKPLALELVDYPVPVIGANELRIEVEACGICGTDFHIYAGEAPASPPVILGHEYVGKIVEIGAEVSGFRIGDRVAIDPNIHCGYCDFCRTAKVHLCTNLKALGVTMNGGFAEYSLVPAKQAYHIPKDFPSKVAAFAEPLSCCLRGIQQASINLNDSVVIIGGGTIGLLMLQLARLKGASQIFLIEPILEKRVVAKQLFADEVLDPTAPNTPAMVHDLTRGGANVVIECVGDAQAAELSLKLVKRGGKIVLFGLCDNRATLNLNLQKFFHRELTIAGSLLNPFTFQTAVDLLVAQKVEVEPLNPVPLNLERIISFFSQPRTNSIIKYQLIQHHS